MFVGDLNLLQQTAMHELFLNLLEEENLSL